MRNWIAYEQKKKSLNKITIQQIQGPKIFDYSNKNLYSKQAMKIAIYS